MTGKTVSLPSGAQCTIKPLSWKAYKPLRALLVAVLTGPVTENVLKLIANPAVATLFQQAIATQPADAENSDEPTPEPVAFTEALGRLAGETIANLIDEIRFTLPDLVNGVHEQYAAFQDLVLKCCVEGVTDESDVQDVATAVAAAIESIDLGGLLALEKNCLAGIVKSAKRSLGTNPA